MPFSPYGINLKGELQVVIRRTWEIYAEEGQLKHVSLVEGASKCITESIDGQYRRFRLLRCMSLQIRMCALWLCKMLLNFILFFSWELPSRKRIPLLLRRERRKIEMKQLWTTTPCLYLASDLLHIRRLFNFWFCFKIIGKCIQILNLCFRNKCFVG